MVNFDADLNFVRRLVAGLPRCGGFREIGDVMDIEVISSHAARVGKGRDGVQGQMDACAPA